jgi:predicted permease
VGQPVIRGRGITDQDTATTQKIAVVNQAFVKKFFPKEDPMGRHFGVFDQKFSSEFEIVGIVADAKYNNPRGEMRPMYFRPLNQQTEGLTEPNMVMAEGRSLYINSVTLRFERAPQNVDAMVRRTLQKINPNLTVIDLRSLDYQVAGNFMQERLISRLTILFGVLALVLASVGLYGITSYQVARRTSEIGLRMALGANRGAVVKTVLRGALLQAGIGLAIGIPVALLATRWMTDQLYQVRSYDPVSLLTALAVLLLSATVAGFIPARRASRIEPMQALRTE